MPKCPQCHMSGFIDKCETCGYPDIATKIILTFECYICEEKKPMGMRVLKCIDGEERTICKKCSQT